MNACKILIQIFLAITDVVLTCTAPNSDGDTIQTLLVHPFPHKILTQILPDITDVALTNTVHSSDADTIHPTLLKSEVIESRGGEGADYK